MNQRGYYGMAAVMHEILHKQAVGGGFTPNNPRDSRDMRTAIDAVGSPVLTLGHNHIS